MAKNRDSQKTVPVVGELFARRVKGKGFTYKELAKKAGVSVRKISECAASKPAKPSTVRLIAPHLDLTYEEITGATAEQASSPAPHKSISVTHNSDGTITVQIVFAKSCKPPLKPIARKYMGAIGTLLGFEDEIDYDAMKLAAGSLFVTVPLSRRDADKLMNAFFAGELKKLDVIGISIVTKVPDNSASPDKSTKTARQQGNRIKL